MQAIFAVSAVHVMFIHADDTFGPAMLLFKSKYDEEAIKTGK